MTYEQQMEQFSLAYIRAVVARAGYQVTRDEVDTGLDGMIKGDTGRRPRMEFQAKSTADDIRRGGYLHFPLLIGNYDLLRDAYALVPRILIVVLLPKDVADWLCQDDDELCLRRCGYWLSLEDQPSVTNTATRTVQIPTSNVFNAKQLHDLMQSV